jgi:hypothetical protein
MFNALILWTHLKDVLWKKKNRIISLLQHPHPSRSYLLMASARACFCLNSCVCTDMTLTNWWSSWCVYRFRWIWSYELRRIFTDLAKALIPFFSNRGHECTGRGEASRPRRPTGETVATGIRPRTSLFGVSLQATPVLIFTTLSSPLNPGSVQHKPHAII